MERIAHLKHKLSKIKKRCYNYMENNAIEHKRGKIVTVSVSDLLFRHTNCRELLRCDIAVRYLAIENYYWENNIGFEIYLKMQDARKGWLLQSLNNSNEDYLDDVIKQFKKLIASYEKNGYDYNSHIILDKNLNLIDGSHRVALALYFGIKNITALVIDYDHPVDYSIDWFLSVGFTEEEIDLIINTSLRLSNRFNSLFSCVIWSPAVKFADAIIHDLGYYGSVENIKKYNYKRDEYENIVRAVYDIDDIEKWKIEKKLEHMKGGELVAIDVRFEEPSFRIKSATSKPISQRVERVKKVIRGKYQKYIEDYYFDIILHIADNYQQSDYMRHIFEPGIDFREVLEILEEYSYALLKVDVPFMPEDFPERIPSGKDIDILCGKEDMKAVKEKLVHYIRKYTEYEIIEKNSPDRLLLRMQLSGKLIFQIDCCCKYEGIPEEFLEYALQSRGLSKKGYYILEPAVEAIIRKVAFESNPDKAYHLEYYTNNRTEKIELMFEKWGGGALDDLIFELQEFLDRGKIPYEEVCIVGSSVLDFYGVRKAHDLDFIVSSKYAEKFAHGAVKVTENCEKVREGWLRSGDAVIFSDDEIINNPRLCFLYKGFKIVEMTLVVYKKSIIRREKDLEDLRLIISSMQ